MKLQGIFIKALPITSGESAKGTWVRGGFVIETIGEYPKKVAFTTFGEEKIKMAAGVPQGMMVEVSFSPESREFNDKWYTELKAINITTASGGAVPAVPAAPAMPTGNKDDLPF